MSTKNLLTIAAIVSGLFGIGLLLMPQQFMSSYGITLDGIGLLFARSIGALLLGLAFINWYARETSEKKLLKGILLGNIITHFITLFIDFSGVSSGLLNSSGWGAVVIHLLFLAGFGYFYLQDSTK